MRLLKDGMKIGHATVIVDIVSKHNPEVRPGIHMTPKHITDHDTGNARLGADAEMHNRYIHNMASYNPRDTNHVSWHLTVDENFIYQHVPFDEPCFHTGDGWGLTSGNRTSIGVEKCMQLGADRTKIEENAIALHVLLMKEFKFSISDVRPHQSWSGKYCPAVILNKYGSFKPYRDKIEASFNYAAPKVASVSAKVHTVVKGDTLSRIAVKNNVSLEDLIKANHIKNANFIYLNQRIVIPFTTVVKPVVVKPAPVKKPVAKKEYVQLPKSAESWKTYKLNVQPVSRNSDWSLTPKAFNGLEYQVLGKPFSNVVTINTGRGKRNIYVGPGTGAKLIKK